MTAREAKQYSAKPDWLKQTDAGLVKRGSREISDHKHIDSK